jgi:hypothetical protein
MYLVFFATTASIYRMEEGDQAKVTKFIIYRADSQATDSSRRSAYTAALNSSQLSKRKDYIEASTGPKDVFFIFLFLFIFFAFLGLSGWGCYLAYQPLTIISINSYAIASTDLIYLPLILTQVLTTVAVCGLLMTISNAILTWKPKVIYQLLTFAAPAIYGILGVFLFWKWQASAAAFILLILFVLHLIYLMARRRHIKIFRFLMISSAKFGETYDKYISPLLILLIGMSFTAYALAGAFGFFKMYLNNFIKGDAAVYGFCFSVVVFGWTWFLNIMRNLYKLVIAGLCLNELLREGELYDPVSHLRPKLWHYSCTRFFGQVLHSSFLLTLAEMFVLLILFMHFENIRAMKSYLWLLIICQHALGMMIRQNGLIHNVMFGSSFFDGTFDVYIPFIFTDELVSHVMSLLLFIMAVAAGYIIAPLAAEFLPGRRAETTADFFALVSIYACLLVCDVFIEHVKTAANTHIVSYGENPLVLSRTSPNFTNAVRAVQVSEEDKIPEE